MRLPSRYSSSRANFRVSRSTHFMMPVLPAVVPPWDVFTGWPFISQSSTAACAMPAAVHASASVRAASRIMRLSLVAPVQKLDAHAVRRVDERDPRLRVDVRRLHAEGDAPALQPRAEAVEIAFDAQA